MPPKATNALVAHSLREKWVTASWMPHSTLSQTSHISLSVRSVHVVVDELTESEAPSEKECKVRVGIHGNAGLPLVPLTTRTPAAAFVARQDYHAHHQQDPNHFSDEDTPAILCATHDCTWDYLIHLPVRWRDLPRDSYLLFELLGKEDSVLYQAPLPFFSLYGKMATGLQRIDLQSEPLDERKNHGLHQVGPETCIGTNDGDDQVWTASYIIDQIEKSEHQQMRQVDTFGKRPRVPWLDGMTKERAKQTIRDELSKDPVSGFRALATDLGGKKMGDTNASFHSHPRPIRCIARYLYNRHCHQKLQVHHEAKASLIVELPDFEIPILHEETFYPIPHDGASGAVAPLDLAAYHNRLKQHSPSQLEANISTPEIEPEFDPLQLVPFLDYENERDNPVEDKYRTLAHDLLRGLVDPALKPDREQRDRLAAIIDSPSHHPSREEKDLLWRFRFSLVDNRRALTKFLLAVDWTVDSEVVQAAELLEQWRRRSPIEVTDALKLLGKHVAFQTNLVRSYAIDTLAAASDSELRLYLLQLVQALKYENLDTNTDKSTGSAATGSAANRGGSQGSSLATFLINRAAGNIELANYLYWYLKVELEDPTHGARYRKFLDALKIKLSNAPYQAGDNGEGPSDDTTTAASLKSIVDSMSTKIGSTLRGNDQVGEKQEKATMWDVIESQDGFISGVLRIQKECRDTRGKKDSKEAELKALLAKEGFGPKSRRRAVPLPSSPDIWVNGVVPNTAKMFKSALYPALLEFSVDKHSSKTGNHKVIIKTGDDLRQDQLIIMMIQLMDRLLKRAALDLCLTPYAVIATSPSSGLLEFVDCSMPISQVLANSNGSILQYLQTVAPHDDDKYKVRPDVMNSYVRSCAGYCVITYLLGVGDRHLDNLMLRTSGHFFHIDFGFIFGRDPKPLPPAFRLTREMVDAMGGLDSSEYRQFCSLACQAFNALRKTAGLILNLLHLMSDAGIEDLSNNPTADAEGVLAKVEERFRLDLTDEQAERFFVGLINDCLAALAPRINDVFHSFAVARR